MAAACVVASFVACVKACSTSGSGFCSPKLRPPTLLAPALLAESISRPTCDRSVVVTRTVLLAVYPMITEGCPGVAL